MKADKFTIYMHLYKNKWVSKTNEITLYRLYTYTNYRIEDLMTKP